MIITLAMMIAVVCVLAGLFLYAVHARWFSKIKNGFLLTVVLAVAGSGVLVALVLTVWSAEIARQILYNEIVYELTNVGEIVEANLKESIGAASTDLEQFADDVAGELSKTKLPQLDATLRQIEKFNDLFLQINAYDSQGQLIDATSLQGTTEPVNRVAVAYALEGKMFVSDAYESPAFHTYVLYVAVPVRDANKKVIGVLTGRYDLERDLTKLIGTTRFDGGGYAVITDNAGRILAHPDPKRRNDDISSYSGVKRATQGQTGWVVDRVKSGEQRFMVYRPLDSPATINPKPWVLLTEIAEAAALKPIRALELRLLLGACVVAVICILIAHQVSWSVKRPVSDLVGMVRKVQGGDLTARTQVEGQDEMGQLGKALNEMVHGLQERDRVKEVFGRYVATQVSDKVLKGEVNLGGEMRRCTILFSDIRNFTEMSEKMTPAQVVSFLNDYFSEMVEAVIEQNGVLDKFIGDGMLAVFGSMEEMPDHPRRAVLAALRMKALVAKINGDRSMQGKPPIGIGIGIHTDEVIVGNIGSRKRLEYTVVGDGVNTTSRVEALNKEFGTTILITETTYEAIKDQFECRHMPDAKIRGKSKTLAFYEVLSVKQTT